MAFLRTCLLEVRTRHGQDLLPPLIPGPAGGHAADDLERACGALHASVAAERIQQARAFPMSMGRPVALESDAPRHAIQSREN